MPETSHELRIRMLTDRLDIQSDDLKKQRARVAELTAFALMCRDYSNDPAIVAKAKQVLGE